MTQRHFAILRPRSKAELLEEVGWTRVGIGAALRPTSFDLFRVGLDETTASLFDRGESPAEASRGDGRGEHSLGEPEKLNTLQRHVASPERIVGRRRCPGSDRRYVYERPCRRSWR